METHGGWISDVWAEGYSRENPDIAKNIEKSARLNRGQEYSNTMKCTALQSENRGVAYVEDRFQEKTIVCPIVAAAIELRKKHKLSQAKFARCLSISPRTLRDWEQARREPSGAALTLLTWVIERPEYLLR